MARWDVKDRLIASSLVGMMIGMPAAPVLAQQSIEQSSEPDESFNFGEMAPSVAAPLITDAKKNATRARTAPVSSSGDYFYSMKIDVPPGRNGMTPSLSLSYSSGSAKKDSEVGAGWALDIGSIARSALRGFPTLKRVNGALIYNDASSTFVGPDGLLEQAEANVIVPPGTGLFYVPRRESRSVRYEYFATGKGYWVQHDPSGIKRWYGHDPAGRDARLVNELGTHEWFLLYEEDVDGNGIVYNYHNISDQDRGDLKSPQREPVVSSIRWGGNRFTGIPHAFSVQFRVGPQEGPIDMLRGHRTLRDIINSIEIRGPGNFLYWLYLLNYETSFDSGRQLLVSVDREAPNEAGRRTVFRYSSAQHISAGPDGTLFDVPKPLPTILGFHRVYTNIRRIGVDPAIWTEYADDQINYLFSPPGFRGGYKFIDYDGDGDTDVLYHPAGIGTPKSAINYALSMKQENGHWAQMAPKCTNLSPDDPYQIGMNCHWYASQLGDLDGDHDVDALQFYTQMVLRASGRGNPGPSLDQCLSEQFWNRCGAIDPVPADFMKQFDIRPVDPTLLEGVAVIGGREPRPVGELPRLLLVHPPADLLQQALALPSLWKQSTGGKSQGRSAAANETKIALDVRAGYLHMGANGRPALGSLDRPGINDCMGEINLCYELIADVVDASPFFDTDPPCDADFFTGNPFCPGQFAWAAARDARLEEGCNVTGKFEMPFVAMYQPGDLTAPGGYVMKGLEGWPGGIVQKATISYVRLGSSLNNDSSVRTDSDVLMPLVDINADGRSDLVLLKWLRNGYQEMTYDAFFIPRAYLNRGNEFDLDAPYARKDANSEFTESIASAVSHTESCGLCRGSSCRYPSGVSFNSMFVDVNADGLPDLVLAAPPIPLLEDKLCVPGHNVFFNRGYRWEPLQGVLEDWSFPGTLEYLTRIHYIENPFGFLRNHDNLCRGAGTEEPAFGPDGNYLPSFKTAAAADINADGRMDYAVTAAMFAGVYLNTNNGFVRGIRPYSIPSDVVFGIDTDTLTDPLIWNPIQMTPTSVI